MLTSMAGDINTTDTLHFSVYIFCIFLVFFLKKNATSWIPCGNGCRTPCQKRRKFRAQNKFIHDYHNIKHDNHRAAIGRNPIIHVEPRKARKTRKFSPHAYFNPTSPSPASVSLPVSVS